MKLLHLFCFQFHLDVLKSIDEALSPEPNYYQEIGKVFLKHVSLVKTQLFVKETQVEFRF